MQLCMDGVCDSVNDWECVCVCVNCRNVQTLTLILLISIVVSRPATFTVMDKNIWPQTTHTHTQLQPARTQRLQYNTVEVRQVDTRVDIKRPFTLTDIGGVCVCVGPCVDQWDYVLTSMFFYVLTLFHCDSQWQESKTNWLGSEVMTSGDLPVISMLLRESALSRRVCVKGV